MAQGLMGGGGGAFRVIDEGHSGYKGGLAALSSDAVITIFKNRQRRYVP